MDLEDLADHRTSFVEPITTTYRGHKIYELPPPTQVESKSIACLHTPRASMRHVFEALLTRKKTEMVPER